ncbi:L-seryl-tRNA(Sec) selenium transferase [Salibacterium aidingense]|uniref:L-seryl-tRNA(Sec) selenium transferase n=1 Tax=Salibacterium aidingense TaxID=384933 RepID=UPI003BC97085
MTREQVRWIPPIHDMQNTSQFQQLQEHLGDSMLLTNWLREETDNLRTAFLHGSAPSLSSREAVKHHLFERLEERLHTFDRDRLVKIINATGTVLHTNLGRASMSEAAVQKVHRTARYYSNLEYNITTGERGSRHAVLEDLLQITTGAEAAMVVNNNAAAVYFVLKALASEKEVIVSRGQLVEIGGSFRVSSIMEESGARLVEVGTTNKTRRSDYEKALGEETAMLMKVHTSNFTTIGFTEEVPLHELTDIAEENGDVLVYEDLGSGALYDFKKQGIGNEPTVKEALSTGADLVTFSGDKLLGGPQAGIIAGKKKWIDALKKHQLARVLRVDKMTLAALEETLKAYAKGEADQIPSVRMVLESKEEVKSRAWQLLKQLTFSEWRAQIEEDVSKVGGGTMPEVEIPTAVVSVATKEGQAQKVVQKMRTEAEPSIAARMKNGKIWMDLRTVAEEEIAELASALLYWEAYIDGE